MVSQGQAIKSVRQKLLENGWTVVFASIPNTAHIGVVPITIRRGAARQRYPDILATRGEITRLLEIEPYYDDKIAANIVLRLNEQVESLSEAVGWQEYRRSVKARTDVDLPSTFKPKLDLVVCNPRLKTTSEEYLAGISPIQVSTWEQFPT